MKKVLRVKSFVDCWIHQVSREKFHGFDHHHLHGFTVFQNNYMRFNKTSCQLSLEPRLELSLADSEMDESAILTHASVCRFYAFQDDHAVIGEELWLQ